MPRVEEKPQSTDEVAYSVEIRFLGLCPLVPGCDLRAGTPQWVGAFLVNASASNLDNFKAPYLPAHHPFIEYSVSDLQGMENAPPAAVLSPLKHEDIVFVPPKGSCSGLVVDFSKDELQQTPASGEEHLLNWITSVDGITPGKGDVDPSCFSADPSLRVMARAHITQGTLQADRIANFKKRILTVSVDEGGQQIQRAVAKAALLTIRCAPGNFRIRFKKFDADESGEGESVRELVFRQPAQGGSIKIVISNLCGSEILPSRGDDLSLDEALRPDEDFRCNYILSRGVRDIRAGAVPIPSLVEAKPGDEDDDDGDPGGGPDGVQCSPPKTKSPDAGSLGSMLARVGEILEEEV